MSPSPAASRKSARVCTTTVEPSRSLSSTFSDSEAEQQGGAILNAAGGTINITATTFSGNIASQDAGGAICNENASLTLTGCTLTGNTAGSFGGGVCNYAGGTLVVSGTTISNNTADFWGGGIFNYIDATASPLQRNFHRLQPGRGQLRRWIVQRPGNRNDLRHVFYR